MDTRFFVSKVTKYNVQFTIADNVKNQRAAELQCEAAALEAKSTDEKFFIVAVIENENSIVPRIEVVGIYQAITGTCIRSSKTPSGWDSVDTSTPQNED